MKNDVHWPHNLKHRYRVSIDVDMLRKSGNRRRHRARGHALCLHVASCATLAGRQRSTASWSPEATYQAGRSTRTVGMFRGYPTGIAHASLVYHRWNRTVSGYTNAFLKRREIYLSAQDRANKANKHVRRAKLATEYFHLAVRR